MCLTSKRNIPNSFSIILYQLATHREWNYFNRAHKGYQLWQIERMRTWDYAWSSDRMVVIVVMVHICIRSEKWMIYLLIFWCAKSNTSYLWKISFKKKKGYISLLLRIIAYFNLLSRNNLFYCFATKKMTFGR